MSPSNIELHNTELKRLCVFVSSFTLLAASSYMVPGLELIQPWLPGEPVPLVSLIFDPETDIRENGPTHDATHSYGEVPDAEFEAEEEQLYAALAAASRPNVAPPVTEEQVEALVSLAENEPHPNIDGMEILALRALSTDSAPSISLHREIGFDRGLTQPTPLEMNPGAMDAWFSALAAVQAGDPGTVARVMHFGDSTIAGDGIARTIRRRLQTRFGDGGPGFLSVHVDPRWSNRPGIARWTEGDWVTHTITHGGREVPYYGPAGMISTTETNAHSVLGGYRIEGERQPLHSFEVHYQLQPGGGTLLLQPSNGEAIALSTHAETVSDAYYALETPDGSPSITVQGNGDGPVSIYGVAMETEGPGITWETMGVAGASNRSMFRQNREHFIAQVQHRNPHLVIYQMGGNELGYPSLHRSGGRDYQESFRNAIRRMKAAAPQASCMVISPLDQAENYRGQLRSKEMVSRMVSLQREVALEEGCAFWNAWNAMGGQDSFARWMEHDLALSDLYHLSNRGLNHIGHALSDAMEDGYGNWLMAHMGRAPLPAAARNQEPNTTSETPTDEIAESTTEEIASISNENATVPPSMTEEVPPDARPIGGNETTVASVETTLANSEDDSESNESVPSEDEEAIDASPEAIIEPSIEPITATPSLDDSPSESNESTPEPERLTNGTDAPSISSPEEDTPLKPDEDETSAGLGLTEPQ